MVDLRKDRAHVADIWNATQESCVPLCVAAAFTFHQTRSGRDELLSEGEYLNALDIAAAQNVPSGMPVLPQGRAAGSFRGHGLPVGQCLGVAIRRDRRKGAAELLACMIGQQRNRVVGIEPVIGFSRAGAPPLGLSASRAGRARNTR